MVIYFTSEYISVIPQVAAQPIKLIIGVLGDVNPLVSVAVVVEVAVFRHAGLNGLKRPISMSIEGH